MGEIWAKILCINSNNLCNKDAELKWELKIVSDDQLHIGHLKKPASAVDLHTNSRPIYDFGPSL